MERIDKILAHSGFGTRKDVKKLLHQGLVSVNGKIIYDSAFHVDFTNDAIVVDGEKIGVEKHHYLMMNKCQNVVCSTKEGEHQTVFDLVDEEFLIPTLGGTLHTIGRLDIDTEGLLILTTDGDLTHRIISPKTHISKTYAVKLRDRVSDEMKNELKELFKRGFHISADGHEAEFDAESAELEWKNHTLCPEADCLLTISEGKYHQVKRMFLEVGNEVVFLKRIAMGKLFLDPILEPGEYKRMTKEELDLLV